MINLLFVDDEQSVLDGLKRTLRPLRREWTVSFAASGRQALDVLQQASFHGIVTDMRMPGMDGLSLLKQVAECYPNLLRVVLSGQSEMESVAKSADLTHHYLAKPCPLDILSSTVNRAFSLRRLFSEPALVKLVSEVNWDPINAYRGVSRQELVAALLENPDRYEAVLRLTYREGLRTSSSKGEPVNLVQQLGAGTTAALLVAAEFCRLSFRGPQAEEMTLDGLLPNATSCSSYAERVARVLAASDGELHRQAKVGGLLLDLGQLVLQCNFPERYRDVQKLATQEKAGLSDAETKVFGTSHSELSAYILSQLSFPDAVVEAVAFHHKPGDCPHPHSFPLLAIHIADVLSREGDTSEVLLDCAFLDSIGQADDLSEWRKAAVRH